jgi:hypothetical protein
MARELSQEALELINPLDGPIPGGSLTNSPDSKQAWEQPPEMTGLTEATEKVFLSLLEEENLETVVNLMVKETPISDIAQMLLFTGFAKGKFNPDLMTLLIEPTMYMLLAIAEKVGIDPIIYKDEHLDREESDAEDIQANIMATENLSSELRNPRQFSDLKPTVSSATIPPELIEKLEEVDTSKIEASLLGRPIEEEEVTEDIDSLLQRK